jgi:Cobalamin-independent synthase, Catalytic domain
MCYSDFNDIIEAIGVSSAHSPRVPTADEIEQLLIAAEARVSRDRLWGQPRLRPEGARLERRRPRARTPVRGRPAATLNASLDLKLQPPQPSEADFTAEITDIRWRDRLGGLIHVYHHIAA